MCVGLRARALGLACRVKRRGAIPGVNIVYKSRDMKYNCSTREI
jgi:hypothetical protein